MADFPSTDVLLWASAIVGLGAAVQGSVGIGFGLIAAPLLAQFDTRFVPAPIIISAMVLVILTALRDRHGIDLSGVGWATLGRIPASALGAVTVVSLGASDLQLMIAIIVLAGVAMSMIGADLRPSPRNLVVAGALSGFMGTASSIGGPPIALVYQRESGDRLRGTLAVVFIAGGVVSLIALGTVGRLGRPECVMAFLLMPGVVLGFILSQWLKRPLDRGYTRAAVLVLSGVSAVLLLARQLI